MELVWLYHPSRDLEYKNNYIKKISNKKNIKNYETPTTMKIMLMQLYVVLYSTLKKCCHQSSSCNMLTR